MELICKTPPSQPAAKSFEWDYNPGPLYSNLPTAEIATRLTYWNAHPREEKMVAEMLQTTPHYGTREQAKILICLSSLPYREIVYTAEDQLPNVYSHQAPFYLLEDTQIVPILYLSTIRERTYVEITAEEAEALNCVFTQDGKFYKIGPAPTGKKLMPFRSTFLSMVFGGLKNSLNPHHISGTHGFYWRIPKPGAVPLDVTLEDIYYHRI